MLLAFFAVVVVVFFLFSYAVPPLSPAHYGMKGYEVSFEDT